MNLADTRTLTGTRGDIRNFVGVSPSGVSFEQKQSMYLTYLRTDAKQERPDLVT